MAIDIQNTVFGQQIGAALPAPAVAPDTSAKFGQVLGEVIENTQGLPPQTAPGQKAPKPQTDILTVMMTQAADDSDATEVSNTSKQVTAGKQAKTEFLRIMSMTPDERFFELLLKKKGLTKDEFDALPPEDKEKIMEQIRAEIEDRLENGASDSTPQESKPGRVAAMAETAGVTASPTAGESGGKIPRSPTLEKLAKQLQNGKTLATNDMLMFVIEHDRMDGKGQLAHSQNKDRQDQSLPA